MTTKWPTNEFGNVIDVYQPETIAARSLSGEGDFPVYGANGIIGFHTAFNHEKSELVLGCRGSVGAVHITRPKAWINGNAMVVRPKDSSLDKKFIMYGLLGGFSISYAISGTAQPQITRQSLHSLPVPIPPLDEQKRIVAKLDEAFGYVDELDANIGQRTASIFDLRKSLIRSTHASVSDWSFRTLPELSTNLDSFRIPITKNLRIAGDVPYYGASGVVDYVKNSVFNEDLLLISEDGANLLARSTAIAFSISGPSWVNNHAHVLRFENLVDQKYVEHYLESINIDDYVSGAAQPKLNQSSLNKIPIPWPNDLAARRQIVQRIEDAITLTSEHHDALIAAKIETMQLRSSVLANAFAGAF